MDKNVLRFLGSDEEIPDLSSDELEDDMLIPVYEDENRFLKDSSESLMSSDECGDDTDPSSPALYKLHKGLETKMINQVDVKLEQCVFSKIDLFCLQTVEPLVGDAEFLWFLKYVKYKDLNKKHDKHLTSCLIPELNAMLEYKQQNNIKKSFVFTFVKVTN